MIDLPPELAALITAERAAKVASAAERIAVRAKLAASVGAAPLGSAAVGATLAGTGKALAIVAITLAAGGGAALALRGEDAPTSRAPTHAIALGTRGVRDVVPPPDENAAMTVITPDPVLAPAPVAAPSVADLVSDPPRAESARVAIKAPAPVLAPATVAAPIVDLASERPGNESAPAVVATRSSTAPVVAASVPLAQHDEPAPPALVNSTSATQQDPALASSTIGVAASAIPSQVELIRAAWAAFSAGNATRALALADEDSRARVGGPLAEERDAVRVVALARLLRTAAAQRAADRFFALYPSSVHRALIQRALADEESP